MSADIEHQEEDVEMESGDELEELRNKATRKRGRGLDDPQRKRLAHKFDTIANGWIIFATNIHEEASEDDVKDKFMEYGDVKNIHFNLDRRTGYAKGYAIVQFEKREEAEKAIKELNGSTFLEQELRVDWCFVVDPGRTKKRRVEELRNKATRKRGRGLDDPQRKRLAHKFDTIANVGNDEVQRSVEGWIIFATNIHEEASEDDVKDKFMEYGDVKNIHFNLDRRTGYAKGYAIVQFEKREEAEKAIKELNGSTFLEQELRVDWCFVVDPGRTKKRRG
uniref:RNA-binding protein 8A n=1 Tax=Panagrolaimus sp. JU765 TaxID=591449 RepID=A0AC34QJW5_9BILA